ncbi:hypothetical protein ScPMuIL_017007 [Solemya velum]
MPPFQRKTLVLVGANGVGRRSLKERLIRDDPRRFAAAMPHTSRAPRDGEEHGKGYYFTDFDTMIEEIKEDKFLEHGEFNGNLYGTKLDTIHNVMRSGKMCVLDVNPTSLKRLKNPEFMPYIIFIAAPSSDAMRVMFEEGRRRGLKMKRSEDDFLQTIEESTQIERVYKGYFDLTVVNDTFDESYRVIRKTLNDIRAETQWVPITWISRDGWRGVRYTKMHRVPILLFLFSCVLKSTPVHGLSWQKRLLHEYYQDFNIETGLDSEAKNDGDVEHTIDSLLHKQPEQTNTVVNCGSPPEVQNAHVSHTSTTPGSDATYTCNIQVGATISWNTECQDNGTWTTTDLFCVGRNDLFIGCYTDNRYRDLDGGFTNSRMNTPEFCINYCLQAGFRYAAVQFTTECYCGDTYGKHGLAPENECNQPCPGDPEEICGGSWRQRVYNTKLS